MAPSTMKQWVVQSKDKGFDGLVFKDAPVPKVGDNEVLVKLHAASLNYRDLIIPQVWYRVAGSAKPIYLTFYVPGRANIRSPATSLLFPDLMVQVKSSRSGPR